jgi:hypothetical protein
MNASTNHIATQMRGAAAMTARQLPLSGHGAAAEHDPLEHKWVSGALTDDEYRAGRDGSPDDSVFAERREFAILINECSLETGKPSDIELGLILATANGTQTVADLREQLRRTP